jgi:hypothetical protein
MPDRGLNPLTWKKRHLIACAALMFAGAVAGFLFGWFITPLSRSQNAETFFVAWLHYPGAYWPYMAAGAITAGLAYYSADLLTGAR